MSLLLILAVGLCPLQDTKTILKASKEPYLAALRDLREAQANIESDPRAAIDKLSAIISNRKITNIECKLRVEESSMVFEPYDFFPIQLRGRARIALAKTSPPENAKSLLDDAIADLEKSFKEKKVAASEAFLKTAKIELERVKIELEKGKDDPFILLNNKVEKLLPDRRFKSAAAVVKGEDGKTVPEDQRQKLIEKIDEECRTYIGRQMADFRNSLEKGLGSIRTMSREEFSRDFANVLPREAEMTLSTPPLDWARKHLPAFKAIKDKEAKIADVLNAALESGPLDPPDSTEPNPWFKAVESIAHGLVEENIGQAVEDSLNKPKARRAELQAKADELNATWKGFLEKLDAKFRARHENLQFHGDSLVALIQRFPVEIPELAAIDLDKVFTGDATEELRKISEALAEIENKVDMKPSAYAVESKQALFTKIVTATALKLLMAGKSENEAANEVGKYRPKLREVGGATPVEKSRYGPRVEKVFNLL